jgi:hypothetical protein
MSTPIDPNTGRPQQAGPGSTPIPIPYALALGLAAGAGAGAGFAAVMAIVEIIAT